MFTVIIVLCSLKSMCTPSFILIGCCVSELHGHLCPYRNVWPEAVYCCFTRTTLFTNMTLRWLSWSSISVQVSFLNSVRFFEIRELKLKKKNNNNNNKKMKNSENELLHNLNNFLIIRFWSFF